jgi:hypothetical protein
MVLFVGVLSRGPCGATSEFASADEDTMSADATAHVWRFSPYKGSTFIVHLAIADSVNDQNGYRLWMSRDSLGDKARVSARSLHDALAALEQDGFLTRVGAKGRHVQYRFLFRRHVPAVWQPHRSPQAVDNYSADPATDHATTAVNHADSARRTKEEPELLAVNHNLKVVEPADAKRIIQAIKETALHSVNASEDA